MIFLYFCRWNQARLEADNHREHVIVPHGWNVLRPQRTVSPMFDAEPVRHTSAKSIQHVSQREDYVAAGLVSGDVQGVSA